MSFTVAYVNALSRPAPVRAVAALNPVAIASAETPRPARFRIPAVNRPERGYTAFYGGKGHPDNRWNDTAVWRRNDLTYRGSLGHMVAKPSTPDRIAGLPRFASMQSFRVPGIGWVAVWALHLHYIGAQHTDPTVDRVAKTSDGMEQFAHILAGFESSGIKNVVLGDLNIPMKAVSPEWTTPWEVFDHLGFQVIAHGIDGGAYSPLLRVSYEVIPPGRIGLPGGEHPGLVLALDVM